MLLLGFGQAVLLIGLVGYPLMYATLSTEGSDTFDALSRSYNYVFQAPWNYIWYGVVAVLYGTILVFFVCFMGSLVVYLTKWSLSLTPGTERLPSRRVPRSVPRERWPWRPAPSGWPPTVVLGRSSWPPSAGRRSWPTCSPRSPDRADRCPCSPCTPRRFPAG